MRYSDISLWPNAAFSRPVSPVRQTGRILEIGARFP
ncbi:hypothetical protein MCBRY_001310 [Methylocystis bryophila]